MPTLDQFKEKYDPVFKLMAKGGVRLDHLHVQDDKMVMTGAACSEDLKNKVWNAIKSVDPAYSDVTCDLSVDTSLPSPPPDEQSYTVKSGDTLGKIAKEFYGDASKYMKIAEANDLADPNKINVGQELKIPA